MKILYLTARQPYPVTKGDQMTAYEQIKELSRKHDIYLISFYNESYDSLVNEMNKYCKKIYLFKDNKISKCLAMMKTVINFNSIQSNCYYRYGLKNKIKNIYNEVQPDIVHVQSFRMAEYFLKENVNKSIDLIDAYSLNMLKRAKRSKKYIKPLWYLEYYLLKAYEQKILKNYKYKFIVAERDKKYLNENSIVVNHIGTILENDKAIKKDSHNNINLIFQGNMSYYPNVQAAEFLINKLFPKLEKIRSNIKLYIVGSNPSKELLKQKSDSVEITGYVESMKSYLDMADVAIYPIFSATGTQSKVLQSMASRIPCIISNEVALGIPGLVNNENILIANNIEEYLRYFKLVLEDKEKINSIVENGYNFIKEHYSWKKHVEVLENVWTNKVVNKK